MRFVCVSAIIDAQDLLLHQEQLPAELIDVSRSLCNMSIFSSAVWLMR